MAQDAFLDGPPTWSCIAEDREDITRISKYRNFVKFL
jgi:hypothetical protein